ncbi:MAG: hypothetical protein OEV29_12925 [Thermoleophilia bacterium]|nr:hypothetical protein [Thermoleophilia bacterium]
MSSYLSEEDRVFMQKVLAHPIHYPDKFESWLTDFLAQNIPKLPISQVFGFKVDKLTVATEITAAETTSSTTYTNLTTEGPLLSNLSNGYYMVFHGCRISALSGATTAATRGFQSLSLNGSTPVDADAAAGRFNPIFRSTLVRLTNNDVNEIKAQYKFLGPGTDVTFERRYLAVMRVVNLDA